MFNNRQNLKKNSSVKVIQIKNEFKGDNTLSTNQSKIIQGNQKQIHRPQSLISFKSIIQKNTQKYGASKNMFYLNDFQQKFSDKNTKQKIILKDQTFNIEEQQLQQFYQAENILGQLQQLLEYYKYYMSYPMIFQKEHFKILFNFYEKKKYLQYQKLKNILNLSNNESDCEKSQNFNPSCDSKRSKKSNTETFYIMNLMKSTFINENKASQHSESNAFIKLNTELQNIIKINQIKNRQTKFQSLQSGRLPFKKKLIQNESIIRCNLKQKSRKQSMNTSLIKKNQKLTKNTFNIKQISPYITQNPSMINKLKKTEQTIVNKLKQRHKSNFSIQQLENYNITPSYNNYNNGLNKSSKLKYIKKRLNSCEDAISRVTSKQKVFYRKSKKLQSCDQQKLSYKYEKHLSGSSFEQYINKNRKSYSIKNNNNNKNIENIQTYTHQGKEIIPNNTDTLQMKIKKLKKKLKTPQQSSNSSLQKYKQNFVKNNHIQQNISNLKQKIKIEKETIKSNFINNFPTQIFKKQRIK